MRRGGGRFSHRLPGPAWGAGFVACVAADAALGRWVVLPVFYAVDVFRYAAVGVSDASPYPALAALEVFAALAFLGKVELIRRGYKLRY